MAATVLELELHADAELLQVDVAGHAQLLGQDSDLFRGSLTVGPNVRW
jgi:hypothetical protein